MDIEEQKNLCVPKWYRHCYADFWSSVTLRRIDHTHFANSRRQSELRIITQAGRNQTVMV